MLYRALVLMLLAFSFLQTARSLEVDDKLTLRILNTSDSKKTILINRGLEDGLAEGDHAKFFLTVGVVARGMIVKVSPTRSIWAVYRLVNPEYVKNDMVLNLKITEAVKLTNDATKMVVKDAEVQVDPTGGIPLAEGADDIPKDITDSERKEMTSLEGDLYAKKKIVEKNWEIFGQLMLNSMSSTAVPNIEANDRTGSLSMTDFLVGFEWYSADEKAWYRSLSVYPYFHLSSQEVVSANGQTASSSISEYGLGVNYHPFTEHFMTYSLIPFLQAGFGVGKAETNVTYYPSNTSDTNLVDIYSGSSTHLNFGLGAKFYLSEGYGARLMLDYLSRKINYVGAAESDPEWTVSMAGFRIYLGLGYRF